MGLNAPEQQFRCIFPNSEPGVVDRREKIDLEKIIVGQVIPTFFNDFDTAMAVLNISLAIQTFYALNMAGFDGTGTVFIEGGFRKNLAYLNLLGALYPEAKIALTKMEEATSFGPPYSPGRRSPAPRRRALLLILKSKSHRSALGPCRRSRTI